MAGRRSDRRLKKRKKEEKAGRIGKRRRDVGAASTTTVSMTEEEVEELIIKKANNTTTTTGEEEEEEASFALKPCGEFSRSTTMMPSSSEQQQQQQQQQQQMDDDVEKPKGRGRIIFILDNALLKKGLVRKKWKILDSEVDANFLLQQKKNPNDYMSSIIFKALRKILDSRLNKAGMVGAVYMKTDQGVLYEVKTNVRFPRTMDRFGGIMLDLLNNSCVRTKDSGEILIHAIEEPVTQHLPVNSRIIGVSHSSENVVDIQDYVSSFADDLNLVFVLSTMLHGKINEEYLDDFISVSNYPSVARFSLGAICNAIEWKWNII